jgi:hypothetical protein
LVVVVVRLVVAFCISALLSNEFEAAKSAAFEPECLPHPRFEATVFIG